MPTTFTGNEGAFININDAADMTAEFRDAYPEEKKGYFYGKNKLNSILNQTDCVGIRIYFGINSSGLMTLVLVGAKANTDDQTSGCILDTGVACPPECGSSNSLNS